MYDNETNIEEEKDLDLESGLAEEEFSDDELLGGIDDGIESDDDAY